MRLALALAVALGVAGCSDLFNADKAPEGLACSTTGTCPPGMQCVPAEHVCRTPCTQTTMNGGMTGPMQNGQCSNINTGNNGTSGQAYNCDYDHFCRPSCMGGGGFGTCSGCSGTDVCDTSVNICRPACGSGCAMGWGCVDVSGSTSGGTTQMICAGCRPTATSTFLPPQFAPVVFYDGIGAQQYPIDAGDLVGNGRPDIIMTDGPGKKIYVYANDGTGVLMAPVAYAVPVGPFHSVVADMNRDGKPDVVVATGNNSAGGPVLYPGNGDHTLGSPVVGPNVTATRLAVGDFDGDGKPDIAQCQQNSSQLTIMTADGMGGLKTLTSFAATQGGNISFVRVGADDFNADQHLDLWGDDEHAGIRLFTSNGNATSLGFSESPNSINTGPRYDATTADMDGDGKLDFVWVQENASANPAMPATIGIAKNNGGTNFTLTNMAAQLPTSGILAIADFDGDGHADVAMIEVQANGKSNVDLLSNDGSKLTWSEQIAIGKGVPYTIAATDLDGDGKPDLVVGLATGGLAVLINQTPSR